MTIIRCSHPDIDPNTKDNDDVWLYYLKFHNFNVAFVSEFTGDMKPCVLHKVRSHTQLKTVLLYQHLEGSNPPDLLFLRFPLRFLSLAPYLLP
mmetsp:Transcript_12536/g.15624  ORF Transcript_12536/g.15624 Transcript_12536/m.15624 type:complete len:93 (-) Transcript_12536:41-319(-)